MLLEQSLGAWGIADWDRIESVRTVSAWLGQDRAVGLQAVRRPGARGHEADAVSAWMLGEEGASALSEARLSTTYDDEGKFTLKNCQGDQCVFRNAGGVKNRTWSVGDTPARVSLSCAEM